ncbi:unnamed protein product [Agarophyton chilense]
MALRLGHVFWALLFLIMFAVALAVNLIRFPSYEQVECKKRGRNSFSRIPLAGSDPKEFCILKVNVTVTRESSQFDTEASTKPTTCKQPELDVRRCWLSESNKYFIPIDREDAQEYKQASRVFHRLRVAFIAFAGVFALFFIYVVIRSFDSRLFNCCCPTFSRNDTNNMHDNDPYLRPPSSNFSATTLNDIAFPNSALQYRISLFIRQHSMIPDQIKKIADEQWTCCICLEQIPDVQRLPHIVRLRCSHAIHAECFRMWVSKGRAVCCICNSPVFSDSQIDDNDSYAPSSPSMVGSRPPGSLIVEITEYSPSSPATSDVVQASQPQADSNAIQRNSAQHDNSFVIV